MKKARAGFTLIEILIVMAIIVVLFAMLLPAVQSARQSAARAKRAANLQQIGNALLVYSTTNGGTFPSGHRVTGGVYYANWAIKLLPYVDQQNLFNQYNDTIANSSPANLPVVLTYLPVYTCPSDLNAKLIITPETTYGSGNETANGSTEFMESSYRAMSGQSTDGNSYWGGFVQEVQANMANNPGMRGPFHTDGDSGLSAERYSNISDGASTTIAVGERTTATYNTRATFWGDGFNLYSVSGAFNQTATLLNDYTACSNIASNINQCKYGWGSFHTAGINFLMCDGLVHCISTSINMQIFCAMSTIANGSQELAFPGF